jgi:hypothetical protein
MAVSPSMLFLEILQQTGMKAIRVRGLERANGQ